jgi:NAD(P)-dependent dehydrogenase (short-subunit alcohol dehydrogenase family)
MKNILLIGASSEAAISLYKNFNQQYNFIRLSREDSQSCVSNFDILDPSTYYIEELKYDGLVYFPGTINLKPFKSLKIEDFYNDFDVSVMGLIKVLKYYHPYFNKDASLVFISSLASKLGMPFHSSVSVAKSALVGLCTALAAEFSPDIRVNCISPSMFKSKMSGRFLSNEKSEERIRNNNPLKKIGESEDISSLIHFLLSDNSKWITGQNISVDGGMSTLKK